MFAINSPDRLGLSKRLASLTLVAASLLWCSPAVAQVPGPPPLQPEPKPKQGPPPAEAEPKGPPPVATEKPAFSKEAVARVEAHKKEATRVGKYGDFLTAANVLEQAYLLIPDPNLAFHIGEAAHQAKDCARALRYYEQFLDASEFAEANMVKAAQKGVNELQTFDCPPRTPEDDAALVTTLVGRAESLAKEKDWIGAASHYARAYEVAPGRPVLAYQVGVAAWNAHLCSDAVSYFYHFRDVADPRAQGRELKQAGKYIDDSETGKCQPWTEAARSQHARDLYDQGQTGEFALDYLGAAGKYERAYELVPANVAIAFRAAEMFWTAQACEQAQPHYRTFAANATDARFDSDRAKSESILARIDAHGCPNALWNTSTSTSSGSNGADGNATDGSQEGPPPVEPKGNSTVACTMVDEPGRGWGATGLVVMMLGLWGRRRVRRARGR